MPKSDLKKLYESQYQDGEWSGAWWYQQLQPFIKTREEIAASLIPKSAESLLDVGCGEGVLLNLIKDKVSRIYGVDLLPKRLAIAQKKLKTDNNATIELKTVNVDEGLPYKDESFDVVTCISVIEYVLDPIATIAEFKRVLKKDGMLIIEVPNLAFVVERVRLLTGNLVGVAHAPGWQGGRLHHFTFSSLESLLEMSGFKVIQRANSGIFPGLRQIWLSLMASDIIVVARKI